MCDARIQVHRSSSTVFCPAPPLPGMRVIIVAKSRMCHAQSFMNSLRHNLKIENNPHHTVASFAQAATFKPSWEQVHPSHLNPCPPLSPAADTSQPQQNLSLSRSHTHTQSVLRLAGGCSQLKCSYRAAGFSRLSWLLRLHARREGSGRRKSRTYLCTYLCPAVRPPLGLQGAGAHSLPQFQQCGHKKGRIFFSSCPLGYTKKPYLALLLGWVSVNFCSSFSRYFWMEAIKKLFASLTNILQGYSILDFLSCAVRV